MSPASLSNRADTGSAVGIPRTARHGEVLRRKISLARGQLNAAAKQFWSQEDVAKRYPELLFNIHCSIRASVPGMEFTRHIAEERHASDPTARAVAAWCSRHIPEERHHDEWLLDDLQVLGVPRDAVLGRVPSPAASNLVGSTYYWVLYAHPVAFMGYAAVIEGDPPREDFLLEFVQRTGLPSASFRTYLKHAQIDPHHSRELFEALDDMPLTPEQTSLLGVVAYQTVRNLTTMFESLTGTPIPEFPDCGAARA